MKLAINGGEKIRTKLFPAQETVGIEERRAVEDVFSRGILSGYRGSEGPNFMGGYYVRKLEEEFIPTLVSEIKKINPNVGPVHPKVSKFKALAINSATSGLMIACKAVGPGGYRVSPWSMSCSATAPMIAMGGIMVFSDISKDYFNIFDDRRGYGKNAIPVSLFGHPVKMTSNFETVIEDSAQSLGAYEKYEDGFLPSGFIGDVGVFSFTQGKLLNSGEGGLLVTNSDDLYEKMSLLRNHYEAVSGKYKEFSSMLPGFNLRMTEIQAAILCQQIKKISRFISMRNKNARAIYKSIEGIEGIRPAKIREGCGHAYYCMAFHYDKDKMGGVHRNKFVEAVEAELMGEKNGIEKRPLIQSGYVNPLYRLPAVKACVGDIKLPIVEKLHEEELIVSLYQGLPLSVEDIQDIGNAFVKVYENIEELK